MVALVFPLLCYFSAPVLGSNIHYRCPDGLFDAVECWRDKTGGDNDRCLSNSVVNVNLIATDKTNVCLFCDNVTVPGIGICSCKETSNRLTCTARLLGKRTFLDGRVAVCSFCFGGKDFVNNAATNGCRNLYAESRSASQVPKRLLQFLAAVLACFLTFFLVSEASS